MRILDPSSKWQISNGFGLCWRDWGDEVLIFHLGSGDTHLLTPVAAAVVREIARHPQSIDDLRQALAHKPGVCSAADDSLKDLLEHLSTLSLIEPCAP